MYPHFLALFSKSGVACAADADHTVFRLSNYLPVAVAVNPASSIPWEKIINDYQQAGLIQERSSMLEYGADFNAFLASIPVPKGWENLPSAELNIIFFGFGSQDIFPSVYDVFAVVKDGVLGLDEGVDNIVNNFNSVYYNFLGEFDSVSTLFWGATKKVRAFFLEKDLDMFQTYAERVRERFRGTKYEDYVEKHLSSFNPERRINADLDNATLNVGANFSMGVDSFSVEDMVTAVETIVTANAELSHLRSGAEGAPADVKEIAVLTIPEGLTWIKHSLYYRRNEI